MNETLKNTFNNPCTCGGYAYTMNGRPKEQPHMAWCPQVQEYAEWYKRSKEETMQVELKQLLEKLLSQQVEKEGEELLERFDPIVFRDTICDVSSGRQSIRERGYNSSVLYKKMYTFYENQIREIQKKYKYNADLDALVKRIEYATFLMEKLVQGRDEE